MSNWIYFLQMLYGICTIMALVAIVVSHDRLKADIVSRIITKRLRAGQNARFRWGLRNEVQVTLALLVAGVLPILNLVLGASLIELSLRQE